MAKSKVSTEANTRNLIAATVALQGLPFFVFFGTLLGLVRDGHLIPGDDDVDLYVPRQARERVMKRLQQHGWSIGPQECNQSPFFLQAQRVLGHETVLLDCYFYDTDPQTGDLIDRWNFSGTFWSPRSFLYLPASMIFPLVHHDLMGHAVPCPQKGEEVCAFLYGSTWQKPMNKATCYRSLVLNNTPRMLRGRSGCVFFTVWHTLQRIKKGLINRGLLRSRVHEA